MANETDPGSKSINYTTTKPCDKAPSTADEGARINFVVAGRCLALRKSTYKHLDEYQGLFFMVLINVL